MAPGMENQAGREQWVRGRAYRGQPRGYWSSSSCKGSCSFHGSCMLTCRRVDMKQQQRHGEAEVSPHHRMSRFSMARCRAVARHGECRERTPTPPKKIRLRDPPSSSTQTALVSRSPTFTLTAFLKNGEEDTADRFVSSNLSGVETWASDVPSNLPSKSWRRGHCRQVCLFPAFKTCGITHSTILQEPPPPTPA
jgi:hypothetical protein